MPLTSNGFQARRLPTIKESIRSRLESAWATPVSSSPDTVIGQLISVFGGDIASQEALNQAQFNQLDINKAEGVQLDRLVSYIGLKRLPASAANGQLLVWRDSEGSIISSVLFEDNLGNRYASLNGLTHSLTECSEVLFEPTELLDATTYTININDANYSYTTTTNPTAVEICDGIANEINTLSNFVAVSVDGTLRVTSDFTNQNDMDIIVSNLSLLEIACFNYVESITTGSLIVTNDTITEIVTANPSLLRCNNPIDFIDGKDIESDELLRKRHQNSVQLAGSGTVPSIRSALLSLTGVNSVDIIENRTMDVVDGLPPKSYECVVEGGNPNDVAQTIWDTKPAGVETHGGITTIVIDASNEVQAVKWSRPTPIYLHVRVTYELYDEEVFPANGDDLIAEAVLNYANSLNIGEDVISTRFIGGIYKSTDGVGNVLVEIGTSTLPTDPAPTAWQTAPIAIARGEYASLATGRIVVINNTP